uniref:non-specific serine/threonine protein kinase n=1 Tax=Mucochytrium quahogii TaxID=96639 RepID=A0A7S2S2S1_9STRA|mmetsp:Transcript_12804/g.20710  ORF Transcript_12804/g.20710 Transcript_12804/m.20710 type:complete len:407 (-) Transcript_12804:868-2088(-)|eukprot:CAMPEP_0203754766 /NCGR_PEP_ID=MMETSP0098-20131031/8330_1 /ASSEMBLY_ACC=CAM_ASM_000208 /TAXON_ID=96639 /ORGANISM=" , Strain NY0313808BC1" /LENGTH=406 /DNA_ID=CAMNT_0050645951 /DNA_START=2896 /DNA_END=4116 /DNA_ORIENTATION=-
MSNAEHASGSFGLDNFKKIGAIASGNVGEVYLVESNHGMLAAAQGAYGTESGKFAMKVLDKADIEKREKVRRAHMERDILAKLCHPMVVHMFCCFQADSKLCYVMEYIAGGTLLDLQRTQPQNRFCEQHAKFYLSEIILGLEYLHCHGVIYRDIKPENVLIRPSGHIVLSDFDLSFYAKSASYIDLDIPNVKPQRFSMRGLRGKKNKNVNVNINVGFSLMTESQPRDSDQLKVPRAVSFVGTDDYMAPEIIRGEKYCNRVDWWSFGILMYEMLNGETPFRGEDRIDTFALIADTKHELRFKKDVKLGKHPKGLLKGLLHKEWEKRIHSNSVVKSHPFFKGVHWALLRNQEPPLKPNIKQVDTSTDSAPFMFKSQETNSADTEETKATESEPEHNYSDFYFSRYTSS